jgi:transposase InsO family protein
MKRDTALAIAGISKHQYYYVPRSGKKGKPTSETTLKRKGNEVKQVPNQAVVEQIKETHLDPDTIYGYHKMTYVLLILGFIINHKKVYRLMSENNLLRDRSLKPARPFVKYRKVMPCSPLELLEMDIKFVWVEEYRRYAYVLTVLDTFTRVVLCWHVAYQIRQAQVKSIWEYIIENYLQPYDCLGKNIQIEIRNDNDSRFLARKVQQFFKENHLMQVFTHPYTPQENGHIESFHAILSAKLGRQIFWSLVELEQCLILFYEKYNNHRLHSSTCYLPPIIFWNCWEQGLIKRIVNEKERKVKFRLLIPYHELSGNMNLREVPCSPSTTLNGLEKVEKEMYGAVTLPQPSVKYSPSVVPCYDKNILN